jgi:hypothetical protein
MGLFNWNHRSGKDEEFTSLARQIAVRTLDEVADRITGLSPEMSTAEARGYIRARAAKVVNREVLLVFRGRRLNAADQSQLVAMATDAIITAILSDRRTLRRMLAA